MARHDGYLDIWDYNYRMNDLSLNQKITDHALTAISVQQQGSFIAAGDSAGVITLLQLCDGLVHPQPNEKNNIGAMFDRETKREKNLEALKKAQGRAGNATNDDEKRTVVQTIDEKAYVEVESKFFSTLGMEGDNLGTAAYLNRKAD